VIQLPSHVLSESKTQPLLEKWKYTLTSAETMGYWALLSLTKSLMSAQALAVLMGPVSVSVAVGSILSTVVAGSSVSIGPKENDSSCAEASANSAGTTMSDLMATAK
jgi:hypothetical protein